MPCLSRRVVVILADGMVQAAHSASPSPETKTIFLGIKIALCLFLALGPSHPCCTHEQAEARDREQGRGSRLGQFRSTVLTRGRCTSSRRICREPTFARLPPSSSPSPSPSSKGGRRRRRRAGGMWAAAFPCAFPAAERSWGGGGRGERSHWSLPPSPALPVVVPVVCGTAERLMHAPRKLAVAPLMAQRGAGEGMEGRKNDTLRLRNRELIADAGHTQHTRAMSMYLRSSFSCRPHAAQSCLFRTITN